MSHTKKILAIIFVFTFIFSAPAVVFGRGKKPPKSGFRVNPALQVVTENSVGIMWETYNPDEGMITVSLNRDLSNVVTTIITSIGATHKIVVNGLSVDTTYYYQVEADGVTSALGAFTTAPEKGAREAFRFIVYGGTRKARGYEKIFAEYGDNDDHRAVCESIDSYKPDFVMHLGDYSLSGNKRRKIYNFFDVEKELLANNPMFPVYGDHEFKRRGGSSESDTLMDNYLIPLEVDGGSFSWYSYDYGNVHFLVLNTGNGVSASDNFDILKPGSLQHYFAKSDLKNAAQDPDIDFIFVAMHAPLYSAANSRDNDKLISYLEDMFKENGVDAVFMGHERMYQHQTKDGIHYILSGAAGVPILDLPWKGDEDDSKAELIFYDDVPNYVIVDLNGKHVLIQARQVHCNGSSTSSVLEEFSLFSKK